MPVLDGQGYRKRTQSLSVAVLRAPSQTATKSLLTCRFIRVGGEGTLASSAPHCPLGILRNYSSSESAAMTLLVEHTSHPSRTQAKAKGAASAIAIRRALRTSEPPLPCTSTRADPALLNPPPAPTSEENLRHGHALPIPTLVLCVVHTLAPAPGPLPLYTYTPSLPGHHTDDSPLRRRLATVLHASPSAHRADSPHPATAPSGLHTTDGTPIPPRVPRRQLPVVNN
ncbi:hypothetical protein FB451DRAFT_1413371 [Mycena latifolia]|nr:hypothetical protein FB451DRAFT_1413371 [Mycena latifolia]